MLQIFTKILYNILLTLYQIFWFSFVLTIFIMFFYLYIHTDNSNIRTWKDAVKSWVNEFRFNKIFRLRSYLTLYTTLILFRTLFNRELWVNPLYDVWGSWWLYRYDQGTGQIIFTTECFENMVLFFPYTLLMLLNYKEKFIGISNSKKYIVLKATGNVFLFSFIIELAQLFFRLGTFQVSDLAYNSLGGFVGSITYCLLENIRKKQLDEEKNEII